MDTKLYRAKNFDEYSDVEWITGTLRIVNGSPIKFEFHRKMFGDHYPDRYYLTDSNGVEYNVDPDTMTEVNPRRVK